MASSPSSTCGNDGSAESTTRQSDNGTSGVNPSTSTPPSSITSSCTRKDNSNLPIERVAAFTNNPSNPNPVYTHTSSKATIDNHICAATNTIEDFDAAMGRHGSVE
ncbi:hypothetical protein VTL71DRAFT_14736 [Oculimacula yallundae]|uniref:Uncharacterized protein n=1 Tax=Oculimacula yallundae TaxID=86028 RepID=A0ABR4CKP0_9HELO